MFHYKSINIKELLKPFSQEEEAKAACLAAGKDWEIEKLR